MFAIDSIEVNLQSLIALESPQHIQVATSPTVGSAPTVASQLRINGGNQVLGRTASASVLGSDNAGESILKYRWETVTAPSGGIISYARNMDNASKNNTLNFNKQGSYAIRVTIEDGEGLKTTSNLQFNVVQMLTSISIKTAEGATVSSGSAINNASTSQRFTVTGIDQFGNAMSTQPNVTWQSLVKPNGSAIDFVTSGTSVTAKFNTAGTYALQAQAAGVNFKLAMNVTQQLTSIVAANSGGQRINTALPQVVTSANHGISAVALDQFGMSMSRQPTFAWAQVKAPVNANATIVATATQATVSFNLAGQYAVRAVAGSVSATVAFDVKQTLTRISVTPGTATFVSGGIQQFSVQGFDQFQKPLTIPSTTSVTWTTTKGTITSAGLYTAGSVAGAGNVTAKVGIFSGAAALTVTTPPPVTGLQSPAILNLVNRLYADGQISRTDMITILRSAGTDGKVDATELADLRLLVSSNSKYAMPSYVKELAKDVVNSNPANLKFKGQPAGNLAAESPATLLNQLVDKWFLGADEPAITGSGISYRAATGTLFASTPSISDTLQGMLGDCYFIASLASIADSNPNAVRNLFIDNGDSTYTVRFYAGALGSFVTNTGLVSSGFKSGTGIADYVTVNRRLPTFSNGTLAYSGSGLSALSPSTSLWIALAEKAYAQWNETGNSGRDGTNRYAAIEGGWMSNVNSQILGYNSTGYSVTASTKQAMINAINANRSITLGTSPGANSSGLVPSHAYIVTGYNVSNDKFTLHNPWGNTHPTPMTWAQLQVNCAQFVVTDPIGSASIQVQAVRSSITPMSSGDWTANTTKTGIEANSLTDEYTWHDVDTRAIDIHQFDIIDVSVNSAVEEVRASDTLDDDETISSILSVTCHSMGELDLFDRSQSV